MTTAISDRIERKIELNASRERVWKAITTDGEFSQWFGAKFMEGTFKPGVKVKASTTHKGQTIEFYITVEDGAAPVLLLALGSRRSAAKGRTAHTGRVRARRNEKWHAGDDHRIRLRPTLARYRAKAYKDNTGGWEHQAKSLANYLAQNS